jgi:hypothetical protein
VSSADNMLPKQSEIKKPTYIVGQRAGQMKLATILADHLMPLFLIKHFKKA